MNKLFQKHFKITIILTVILMGVVSVRSAQAQERICFNEVADCIEGRFATYWRQHGGLPVFGYPITPAFYQEVEGRLRLVQIFERSRFELHPGNPQPYDVLLGRLGDDLLQRRGTPWQNEPKAPSTQQAGCRYFDQTQHLVCGAFLRYWQSHGLEFDGRRGFSEAESLALFGLPLTEARIETNTSGDTVLTQWFERARFELHERLGPEVVLLGLLGREAFGDRPAPPPTPTATPRPGPCDDIPPPVNGSIAPNCLQGDVAEFFALEVEITGFVPYESIGAYVTQVATGTVVEVRFTGGDTVDDKGTYTGTLFVPKNVPRGLYAVTFEGRQSGHKAIVHFKRV
ncbi:hypothetical protein [Chloroflexus sp.]|uniref:hypothetical protein n=1 Tax=Chloroflexus sp. TaxID=1904827 RepID=UPI0026343A97|nr:hypothetical protein [uncultured Chloroflexus sp.]